MSHVLTTDNMFVTITEWVHRLTNEFNELRIGFTDVLKMKVTEFFTSSVNFLQAYESELVWGSLSMFIVLAFIYLLDRALTSEKALEVQRSLYTSLQSVNNRHITYWHEAQEEVEQLHNEIAAHESMIEKMREEFEDQVAILQEQHDEIQAELDEMTEDRDEWVTRAQDFESWYDSEVDERIQAETELDNIKSAVPQMAYAA